MYGYKLRMPCEVPKTVWACKTSVDKYRWKNNNEANMIEFSLCRASKRVLHFESYGDITLEGESVSCLVGDEAVSSYADDGVKVEIASVAVRFSELSYEAKVFDEEDISDAYVLLIPHINEKLSGQEISEFEKLLHKYIHSYMEKSASSQMMCNAIIFELLARLDSIARRSVTAKKAKYINYYVMKADYMISKKYFEKLTLKKVADELGITPSYLCSVYKKAMGIGFSEKLTEIRMEKARELVSNTDLNASEIAQTIGFDDESHMRKQFKRYFGASIREYRCISKEQTLYHRKPQREE